MENLYLFFLLLLSTQKNGGMKATWKILCKEKWPMTFKRMRAFLFVTQSKCVVLFQSYCACVCVCGSECIWKCINLQRIVLSYKCIFYNALEMFNVGVWCHHFSANSSLIYGGIFEGAFFPSRWNHTQKIEIIETNSKTIDITNTICTQFSRVFIHPNHCGVF